MRYNFLPENWDDIVLFPKEKPKKKPPGKRLYFSRSRLASYLGISITKVDRLLLATGTAPKNGEKISARRAEGVIALARAEKGRKLLLSLQQSPETPARAARRGRKRSVQRVRRCPKVARSPLLVNGQPPLVVFPSEAARRTRGL